MLDRHPARPCLAALLLLVVACGDDGSASSTGGGSAGGGDGGAGGGAAGGGGAGGGAAGGVGGAGAGGMGGLGGLSPCPPGASLVAAASVCDGAPVAPPAALVGDAEAATAGDVLSLGGLNGNGVPCLPLSVCAPDDAATLLFSDEPETVGSDGVLFADFLVAGRYRAYVYHVSGGGLRKFPVVMLNEGASEVHATVTARGLAGPTTSYVAAGRSAVTASLTDVAPTMVTVPPGQRVLLDSELDSLHAGPNELVHAIIDFELDGPVKLSVVSVGAGDDATVVTAGLSAIPSTGLHVRGTFPGADVLLVTPPGADASPPSVRRARLGADELDLDLQGESLLDAASVVLTGNFGVRYRFVLDGAAVMGLGVNPRAGAWAGALRRGTAVTSLPGSATSVDDNTTVAFLGTSSLPTTFELASSGGSNLPVHLLVWPMP